MRTALIAVLSVVTAFFLPASGARAAERPPNIIFILADDLGYGDLGVTFQNSRDGSKPRFTTPKLDEMAAQGLILRQHYTSSPVCAPARASLLLGQHQGTCPIRDNQFDKALPTNHTLATVLKAAGYHTVAIGKWGLQGAKPDYPGHPLRHGFDEFFGFLEHVSGHVYYHDAGKPLRENYNDVTAGYLDIYSTDLFTARAKKFITEHEAAKPDQPFFMYLAYTAIHNALQVPGGPYPAGAGRTGGLQWPPAPTPKTKDTWIVPEYAAATYTAADGAIKPWTDPMKRYATMARRLDDGVGDILQLLRDLGLDSNTLVVFTSDNGPANEAGSDPRLFDSWGPFDGFKRDCWEGGVREPTLVRWPGHVPAGKVSDQVSGFWDWMPTLAQAAGLTGPAQSDGVSLMPTLLGAGAQRSRGYAYVEYFFKGAQPASADVFRRKGVTGRGQQQVLRMGDFVGIRTQIKSADDPLRLYNVMTDPHEDHDLAADPAYAEILKRVRDELCSVHRPDADAPRPYDDEPLPALLARATTGTVDADAYEGSWPWVPDFDALTPARTSRSAGLDLAARTRDENIGIKFSGYIQAPAAGEYTFCITSDSGAQFWVNDAHVIDDDFNHDGSEVSAKVILAPGLHPFHLFYRHAAGAMRLELKYAGPGIEKQAVPASAFARPGRGSS
jgi:arylsulfatase A-like enzyme